MTVMSMAAPFMADGDADADAASSGSSSSPGMNPLLDATGLDETTVYHAGRGGICGVTAAMSLDRL